MVQFLRVMSLKCLFFCFGNGLLFLLFSFQVCGKWSNFDECVFVVSHRVAWTVLRYKPDRDPSSLEWIAGDVFCFCCVLLFSFFFTGSIFENFASVLSTIITHAEQIFPVVVKAEGKHSANTAHSTRA